MFHVEHRPAERNEVRAARGTAVTFRRSYSPVTSMCSSLPACRC